MPMKQKLFINAIYHGICKLTQENTWHLVGRFHTLFAQHLHNVLVEACWRGKNSKNEKYHHLRVILLAFFFLFNKAIVTTLKYFSQCN